MTKLIIIISAVFVLQIVLFIVGRRIRKKEKENNVLIKYDIKSRGDAWKLIGDHSIPEEDRKKIESLYNEEDDKK